MDMKSINAKAKPIKILLLDVDGVLTNGKLYFGNSSEELKAFNIKDGLGVKLLQGNGIEVGIVTGRSSTLVANRAKDLGIKIIVQGREDKLVAIGELCKQHNLQLKNIAYMGDDLPDLSALAAVGLSMTVKDAVRVIKETVHWVSHYDGGEGAVREAAELLLNAQNKWDTIVEGYRR